MEVVLGLVWFVLGVLVLLYGTGTAQQKMKKLDFADYVMLIIASFSFSTNLIFALYPAIHFAVFAEFPQHVYSSP